MSLRLVLDKLEHYLVFERVKRVEKLLDKPALSPSTVLRVDFARLGGLLAHRSL